MKNFEKCEQEYLEPPSDECPRCKSEDHTEEKDGTYTCNNCDYNLKDN